MRTRSLSLAIPLISLLLLPSCAGQKLQGRVDGTQTRLQDAIKNGSKSIGCALQCVEPDGAGCLGPFDVGDALRPHVQARRELFAGHAEGVPYGANPALGRRREAGCRPRGVEPLVQSGTGACECVFHKVIA